MKELIKYKKCALVALIMIITTVQVKAQLPKYNPLYDSVFIENFNGSVLDTAKWKTSYDWGNFFNSDTIGCMVSGSRVIHDLACLDYDAFDTTNRVISNGTCKMILRKENVQGIIPLFYNCDSTECNGRTCYYNSDSTVHFCMSSDTLNFKYTNTMLQSKAEFKYGYFEIRFRFPGWTSSAYNGYSPTFWLWNATTPNPWSEIDIYEIYGTNGKFTNCIHVDATVDGIKEGTVDPIPTPPGEPFISLNQWHTASVNWTPDSIGFYLDDTFIRASVNDTNQYLQPMAMFIENTIPLFFSCSGVDSTNTTFPITYEIDYVKAWQPKLVCDSNKVYCNTTQSTFNSKHYQSLTLGGSGCSATFNNGINTAKGVDYVLLQEGFEVGSNMSMLISTEPCWNGQVMQQSTINTPIPSPTNLKQVVSSKYPTN
ncbi:MAG: glycoside hydrolase family 16 protein [Bacteroidota bacterium]|nr:glycoside hydrolase family 16 protein [Bacteroidota bacterium]